MINLKKIGTSVAVIIMTGSMFIFSRMMILKGFADLLLVGIGFAVLLLACIIGYYFESHD